MSSLFFVLQQYKRALFYLKVKLDRIFQLLAEVLFIKNNKLIKRVVKVQPFPLKHIVCLDFYSDINQDSVEMLIDMANSAKLEY